MPEPLRADAASPAGPLVVDRRMLVGTITAFLTNQDRALLMAVRASVERVIDESGPAAVADFNTALANAGTDWRYYAPDPLARRIHHVLADHLLADGSALVGREHLDTIGRDPVVMLANHLSYSDANLVEILSFRFGGASFADRLTVAAGPKVYSSLKRRFSSLCFGTIKTPQSSGVSSEDAVMTARDVVRAARQSINAARERLSHGDALLVFPEGTRTRNKQMQPFLSGVTRYLEDEHAWVMPMGIAGTEMLFPVGDELLHPFPVVIRAGKPFRVQALAAAAGDDRRLMMDTVAVSIANLLPPEYQGVYGPAVDGLDDARRLARQLAAQ